MRPAGPDTARSGEVAAADRAVQRWETCGEAWIALLRHVWAAGEAGMEDLGPIIEGPPALFEIASLSWEDPLLREHGDRGRLVAPAHERTRGGTGPEPRAAERRAAEPRAADHPAAERRATDHRAVEYRARMRDQNGVDQLRWVTGLLRARPWTTSAWISLTVPGEPAGTVPRLVALSFRIRGYRLIMTAMFRSQDVSHGYMSYIPLRGVQLEVAEDLGLPSGPLRVFVDVPHIRVADAERVAGILTALPEPNAA
jgi:thymidylate synthase